MTKASTLNRAAFMEGIRRPNFECYLGTERLVCQATTLDTDNEIIAAMHDQAKIRAIQKGANKWHADPLLSTLGQWDVRFYYDSSLP